MLIDPKLDGLINVTSVTSRRVLVHFRSEEAEEIVFPFFTSFLLFFCAPVYREKN
jgi:hypothetical protein